MCNKILLPRSTAANSQHTPGAGLSVGERRQYQVVDSVGASFGVKSYSILQVSRRFTGISPCLHRFKLSELD